MKKILITGASEGIGRSLAIQFSRKEKVRISLIARNEHRLREVGKIIHSNGSEYFIFPCDVSNKEELQETIRNAFQVMNGIDIAILNAGISRNAWITDDNYSSHLEDIFKVNVFGVAYSLEPLSKLMQSEGGTIAIVSSLADSRGYPSSSAYAASKAAVTRIAESARIELAPFGIKVVTVKPGFVRTNITAKNKFPMPFLMEVDKAAEIIIDGLTKSKRYISFPFATAVLAKFISIIPNRIFEFFASYYKRR
jgi:short-subunit dehydrogenase